MQVRDGDFDGSAVGQAAVDQLGRLVAERQKTRRLLICASCLLFGVAALLVVFAPEGRETLATILGVVLMIFALGAIGVAQFRVKAPGVEVDAGRSGPADPLGDSLPDAADNIPA